MTRPFALVVVRELLDWLAEAELRVTWKNALAAIAAGALLALWLR